MSASNGPKISFTVHRPMSISRAESSESDDPSFKVPFLPRYLSNGNSNSGSPLARSTTSSPQPKSWSHRHHKHQDTDSSEDDEDDRLQDELVTGFDEFGVQRLHEKKKKTSGPLVIPALQNKDWRELARKRRGIGQYVPESAKATTGQDGSVGGLGTRDTINSGPVLSGLQVKKPVKEEEQAQDIVDVIEAVDVKTEQPEQSDDQKALLAVLAAASADNNTMIDGPVIDIIPTPVSESDAFLQDVQELPDTATLEDYARVPVSQFGAALLRGMGWKEGTAASRKKGRDGKEGVPMEPYLPEARPALLGIGAKERVIEDNGSKKKANHRPERRYVPVVRMEKGRTSDREASGSASGSGGGARRGRSHSPQRHQPTSASRRNSRSRSPMRRDHKYKDGGRRKRDYDYTGQRDKDRYKDASGGDTGREHFPKSTINRS